MSTNSSRTQTHNSANVPMGRHPDWERNKKKSLRQQEQEQVDHDYSSSSVSGFSQLTGKGVGRAKEEPVAETVEPVGYQQPLDEEEEFEEEDEQPTTRRRRQHYDDDGEELPYDEEEEEEGEDLMETIGKDYAPRPELDRYDPRDLDDGEYSQMSAEARKRADRVLDARHKRERGVEPVNHNTFPGGISEATDASVISHELDAGPVQFEDNAIAEDWGDAPEEEDARFLDLDELRGKLPNWITDPKTVSYIKRTFKKFLTSFKDEKGSLVYVSRINQMCSANRQSLDVTYIHLTTMIPTIAYWIFESPAIILPHLNATSFELACKYFPGYGDIHPEIYLRIRDFPLEEKIRDLRTFHLNTLIKIVGVVTRRYPVYSQLKKIYYVCGKCGMRMGPIYQHEGQSDAKVAACSVCTSSGPFTIDAEAASYRNYQRITVQESPGTVLPGRVPRYKDVVLFADNIDCARPGDEVEIVGIYTHKFDYGMNVKHGFPVFNTLIEANSVRKLADIQLAEISQQDIAEIMRLSKMPNISHILINSIAPSIYGHFHVKTALTLAMFGGEALNLHSHRVRGDINVLLLGDPGLAKSQFLKYVEKTFHRTIYATGKGASAVGLTASVRRDFSSKEWTLEGGAMVLADQGICLIDEFDKMNDTDRTSIHEAMEQQTISISKAGIVANLQARCSVIAAANPIKGRYDPQLSFADNVNLSEPILSRFDILCVLKDEPEPSRDSDLAAFIINSHIAHHPAFEEKYAASLFPSMLPITEREGQVTQDLLKKYIMYARKECHPKMPPEHSPVMKTIQDFYVSLRSSSKLQGGLAIAARHLESLSRMAQASAKMHLRHEVKKEDVELAISVLFESFLQSQKVSIAKQLRLTQGHHLHFREDINILLLNTLSRLFAQQEKVLHMLDPTTANYSSLRVSLQSFRDELRQMNIVRTERSDNEFFNSEMFTRKYRFHDGNILRVLN